MRYSLRKYIRLKKEHDKIALSEARKRAILMVANEIDRENQANIMETAQANKAEPSLKF